VPDTSPDTPPGTGTKESDVNITTNRLTATAGLCAAAAGAIFIGPPDQPPAGRLGRLGLAGYSLLSAGYLAMFAVECIVGYYLPTVAHSNPGYVQHVINAAMGHGPSGGIGHMHELFLVTGIGYSLGGLLFGITLFRAGVLARWASLLLAYGTTSALALSVLPESFDRPFAVPTGVALIGLGVSLWRNQRRQVEAIDAPATTWVAQPVTR
jgi:hypothetical protein